MERFVIGIDPAADTYVAALMEVERGSVVERQAFEGSSVEEFAGWLHRHGVEKEEALVSVEDTGVYSEALLYALNGAGYRVALVEPHKVWKALSNEAKTDALDSGRIAEYALRYRDKLALWRPNEVIAEQVRVLLSTREQLVSQKTAAMNSRAALRRKVIQTPAANRALDRTIEHLAEQVKALEEELRRLIGQHPRSAQVVGLLMTAPGVKLLLSAHLLVLTNAFTEPVSYRRLAQYVGVCPNPHQSGRSVRRRPRSRGYGPATLRKLLHLAARSVSTHEERFRAYYRRKVREGKPKRLVLNNISNKLLRVICGMLREERPYLGTYRSVNPALFAS